MENYIVGIILDILIGVDCHADDNGWTSRQWLLGRP